MHNPPICPLFATRLLVKLQGTGYQPIMALVLIFIREVNMYIFSKFVKRTSGGDEPGAQLVAGYYLAGRHSLQVCVYLGGKAEMETAYLLMAIDFLTNIYLAVKIVWSRKKRPVEIGTQMDLLQELALNELGEFALPLGFLAVQTMAYFGPNYDTILDLGCDWMGRDKIEDIWAANMTILEFFTIDFCSTIITGIILWYFCKIRLPKAIAALYKDFFLPFTIIPAYWTLIVSKDII